jgi:predicted alpha/beta hydrolase family esterase
MTISFSKEDQNLSMPQKQTLWNQWQSSIINIKRLLYIYIKKRIAENPMVNVLLATRVGT